MENKTPAGFSGKHSGLTGKILNCFYSTFRNLGPGFPEKIYQKALSLDLAKDGLTAVEQMAIPVFYSGEMLGEFYADIVVNDLIILELKVARQIAPEHVAQLMSYLKSTRFEVGLLLNFGPKPTHERKVFDNERKGSLNWTQRS